MVYVNHEIEIEIFGTWSPSFKSEFNLPVSLLAKYNSLKLKEVIINATYNDQSNKKPLAINGLISDLPNQTKNLQIGAPTVMSGAGAPAVLKSTINDAIAMISDYSGCHWKGTVLIQDSFNIQILPMPNNLLANTDVLFLNITIGYDV